MVLATLTLILLATILLPLSVAHRWDACHAYGAYTAHIANLLDKMRNTPPHPLF
jgi:hypothetical protein